MISSKNDYLKYLEQDKLALRKKYKSPKLVHDEIWRFEILLRKTEFYVNCKKTFIGKLCGKALQFLYYKKRLKYNTYIPLNVFGPGLSIAHFGSIVVNGNAKVGENCRIQDSVTIGANAVVIKDFNKSGITIGGVPAKKISDNNSHSNLNKCLEIDK